MKISRIANPAAVAWRAMTDDDVEVEVCWLRGTRTLLMATRSPERRTWSPATAIRNPSFDLSEPTLKAAEEAAKRFLAS